MLPGPAVCSMCAIVVLAADISADQTRELTAADVLGPDGIIYPDWTWAGVPGGIPRVRVRARLSRFGAVEGADISDALEKAVESLAKKGGGALLVDAGTYYLDRPVIIRHDNIVIRGEGPDKTRLINRYGPPEEGVAFFRPRPGDEVNEDTWVEIHCQPDGLRAMHILVDDGEVWARTRSQHWGGTFSGRTTGSTLLKGVADGPHTLKAIAEWDGGRKAETTIKVTFSHLPEGASRERRIPSFLGA
ncbi:MAG: hypothetical protein ACE5O2_09730, partial [Armatimonadota bacterium]